MPGTVTVINKKNVNGLDAVYIGRPSVFGNPFSVRMGRSACIARYGMHFAELMSCETPLKAAVDRLVLRVLWAARTSSWRVSARRCRATAT